MGDKLLQRRGTSVAAMRRLAQRRLPRLVFDFVDGGAEDEVTLRRNETAFADIEFVPKVLNGTPVRDQTVELFGERLATPVIIGPTGLTGMLWPDGEIAAARAAAAAGTIYCCSHGSTCTMEALTAAVPGPKWFQNFMYQDRGLTRAFTERARAAGYRGLILTVDNQVLGWRERDVHNGFTVPPRVSLANGLDMALHLPWVLRMARRPLTFANYASPEDSSILSLGARMASLLDATVTWKDVEWLRGLWPGPLLLKGLLHADEARGALRAGVDGIIVSNHGGRQLDGAVASIRALPAMAEAVEGRIPVLIDGGIRRGADVVKAIALGATACLIGRPHLWGVAVAGETGAAWVLALYRKEIDRVLALGGWDSLKAVTRDAVCLRGAELPPPAALDRRAVA